MISYIRGKVIHKSPVKAILENAAGVAFEINIPISTFEKMPELGEECVLHTILHVVQDDVRLFGFSDPVEKELFLTLNTVSGIGPKIALSIISTMPIPTFVRAIENGEEAILTRVPGIGKKSAQRLIVELKGSLSRVSDHFGPEDHVLHEDVFAEVENALLTLGFNSKEIRRQLSLLPAEAREMNAEALIKETIKRLYQRNH
ncbi:MAG TPA: Holliday junction branch migration protein RuvA [Candidatus Cloacimonetes bacterium]|jgi:Holliday junction DNA helicase RuvA|nr:Holliday junction branch migration protein RuvA [Candidatus Cloacimonadota bacterium]